MQVGCFPKEQSVSIEVNGIIIRNRGNFTLCLNWTALNVKSSDDDDVAQSFFPPWATSASPTLSHLCAVHRVFGS